PAPGATTLGFISSRWSASPSLARGPSFEKSVTVSSLRSSVVLWFEAPTAMHLSAPAGLEMLFWVLPFPVAMHMVMPASTAALTITSSALVPSELQLRHPSDMLMTWTPRNWFGLTPGHTEFTWAMHQSTPSAAPKPAPASESTLQSTSRAPGATPAK